MAIGIALAALPRGMRRLAKLVVPVALAFGAALVPTFAQAQSADIVVNHSDAPDPGPAGGTFTYTIRVDNNGPNDASNVRLSDTLPPGSTFISATSTAGSCAAPVSGVVNCTLGNIAFTQPTTTSRTVTVKVQLPTAGVYTNVVSTASDTSDPNPGNNSNNAESTTAISASDLQLAASAPAMITAGQGFSYTLLTRNLGPDAVPSGGTLTLAFTVPTGLSVTSAPGSNGWTCAIVGAGSYPLSSGGRISCTRPGPLAANATAPALTVPAVTNTTGTVTAAFAVSSTMPDGDLNNNTATASIDSAYGSDVSISFSGGGGTYAQGSNVNYTLVPRYNGGLPPGSTGDQTITVTDTLSAGLTFVSANGGTFWSCAASGQVVTCTHVGTYGGGPFTNMPSIDIVATAAGLGLLGSSAGISIPETDPVPGNNTAGLNINSSNEADLQLTKSVSLSPVVPNQPFDFTLTVRNNGPLAVPSGQQIVVTDTIPADVTVTAQPTGSGFTCVPASGYPLAGPTTISCTRTNGLGSGSTATITVKAVATSAAGSISNTASVQLSGAGRTDSNGANDQGSVSVNSTVARADLVVDSKTASPGVVNAGDDLTYVITVHNAGPDAATNATVTDTLSNLVATGGLQAATPSQGSCNSSANLSCNLGTLNAGDGANVIVKVRPTIASTGTRTNTATINSPDVGDPDRSNNSASVTSNVIALVDVSVGKTATPSRVKAGTDLTYVATVKNNGPSSAAAVTLKDTLPANAAFVSRGAITGSGSCPAVPAAGAVGGTLDCTWPSIPSGTQYTVTYKVRPLTSATGSNLVNSAVVATATHELDTTNNGASTTTPVDPAQLDILVNKFDSVDPVSLGENTVYTITIDNAGPSLGTDVQLVDVFPAPSPARSAVFSYEGNLTVDNGGSCVEPATGSTTGTLSCSFPSLAAGQRATVRYAMKAQSLSVAGALTGTTYNEASVSVAEPETLLTNNHVVHDTTARRFSENADLGILKTTTATTAAPGGAIDYTLTVTNHGPAASTSAQVVDVLPPGTSFVSAPGCSESAGTVTCLAGALANGASRSFQLRLKLDDIYAGPNPLVNAASVDSPGDTNGGNDSASASTPVAGPNLHDADLSVTKTTTAGTIAPGGVIDYTITVSNGGPQASDGATVGDTLPAGTGFVSGAGCTQVLDAVNCAVGPLAVNASKTFNVRLKLDDIYAGANPLVNTAVVTAPGDPAAGNNTSAPVSTPVEGPNLHNADLSLAKTAAAATVAPGGTVRYTLAVTNHGPAASDGASVRDRLPAGTSFVSGAGCSEAVGTVSCAVGPLGVGAARVFEIELRLDDVYAGARPLVNEADVVAPGDPDAGNNTASATTPVAGSNRYDADLSLSKTTTATTVAPGGTIDYTLTVKNDGPQDSDGASVDDPLPAGSTFVSGAGCTAADRVVSCAVGPLAVNAQKVFNLQLKLDSPYAGARPFVNTASIVDAPGDPEPGNNSASASTSVAAESLPTGIPTLSRWTLLLLASLLGAVALLDRRKQRRPRGR